MIDDLERAIEAMLFASDTPLDARQVAARLGDEMTPGEVRAIIQTIAARHGGSGIELVERGGHWHFQTPADLAHLLRRERDDPRKLSRAAAEVLAIVAYHEPVSRAEIEATYPSWRVTDEQPFDLTGIPESTRKDDPRWYRLSRVQTGA